MRSLRLIIFRSRCSSAIKSLTAPATHEDVLCGERKGVMAGVPLLMVRQKASLPIPLGATTPRPVMTTRGLLSLMGVYPIWSCKYQYTIDAPKAAGMAQRDINSG